MTPSIRLLIAEGSEELRLALTDALAGDYRIKVCSDGEQARRLIFAYEPDILILDLMMPQADGITILREMAAAGLQPITITTTYFASPYIQNAMQQLQVDYMVTKPVSVSGLTDSIRELASALEPDIPETTDQATALYAILTSLGLQPKAKGFSYLLSAIPLYINDPRQSLTKELYPAIGKLWGKSGMLVERSIRSAIESAWNRGDHRIWQEYFYSAPNGSVPRPSNGDFICRIAAAITLPNQQSKQA